MFSKLLDKIISLINKPSIEGIVVKYLDFNDLDLADKVQYLIILYKD